MIVTKQKSAYSPFPSGIYTMTVRKVEEGTSKTNSRPFLRWFLEIEDELPESVMKKHKEPVFTVLTDGELTERNNFGRFLNTIGFVVGVGENIDTARLIGHRFIAKVGIISKSGRDNNTIEPVSIPEYERYKETHPMAA